MFRVAKSFNQGHPYLTFEGSGHGIIYGFPNKSFIDLFVSNQHELAENLNKKLADYMDRLGIDRSSGVVPYIQKMAKTSGFELHMMGNGRWFEFDPRNFRKFLSLHNIDSPLEAIAGFNVASDALELLDVEILAPRIRYENNQLRIEYPLLDKEFPIDKIPALTNQVIFSKWFNVGSRKLGDVKFSPPFNYDFNGGRIFIEEDKLIGEIINPWDASTATFAMKTLLHSFEIVKVK